MARAAIRHCAGCLEAGLSDPDPDVQGAAAQALSHLMDRQIPEALRAVATIPEAGPSLLAAQAIDRLGTRADVTLARGAARSADARLQAAHLLCELAESSGCQLLRSLLERGLVKDAGAALSFLESLMQASGGERAFAQLQPGGATSIGDPRSRAASVLAALARAGHEPSRGRLAELAQHPGELQLTAAVALADPLRAADRHAVSSGAGRSTIAGAGTAHGRRRSRTKRRSV